MPLGAGPGFGAGAVSMESEGPDGDGDGDGRYRSACVTFVGVLVGWLWVNDRYVVADVDLYVEGVSGSLSLSSSGELHSS
jgi:hypothetical protein